MPQRAASPCSIHDTDAAKEYAYALFKLANELENDVRGSGSLADNRNPIYTDSNPPLRIV